MTISALTSHSSVAYGIPSCPNSDECLDERVRSVATSAISHQFVCNFNLEMKFVSPVFFSESRAKSGGQSRQSAAMLPALTAKSLSLVAYPTPHIVGT